MALALASCLTLAACGSSADVNDADTPVVGNATPAESPQRQGSQAPAGTVSPMGPVEGLVAVGQHVVVRTKGALHFGVIDRQGRWDEQDRTQLDGACGQVSATDTEVVIPCADGVHIINAANPAEHAVQAIAHPATTAVKLTTGEVLTGDADSTDVYIYSDGSQEPKKIPVEKTTDQMVSVAVPGQPDAVVRINRQYSIIQDVHWSDGKPGAILRVGKGVGRLAPAERGVLLASDSVGKQLAVYSAEEVIRLHQTTPTDGVPWAVAWSPEQQLAWSAQTSVNEVVGYSLESGTPKEREHFPTVANAQHMVVASNGSLVLASASGDGVQVIPVSR